jgi:predicted nucleic acid-binding protein
VIVISDTAPLNYLVLIGCQDILRYLFARVIIPRKVFEELQRDETPNEVQKWLDDCPSWLEVKAVEGSLAAVSESIGEGEREAIALAEELRADILLIDDRDGRTEAARRGVAVTGTLGVLRTAARARPYQFTRSYRTSAANILSGAESVG